MATLVSFHAHPDDESISTAGVLRKAADDGHRVVLVFATRGELGEVEPGFLAEGEPLEDRRVIETHESARILGAQRVEFLGYRDSGMMGEPTNDGPGTFWTADVQEAAERLAAILRDESADVLTVYDDHGGYGHPDHIQVHRVGMRAAELAGTPRVYQASANRDLAQQRAAELRAEHPEAAEQMPSEEFLSTLGLPEAQLTARVDVSAQIDAKRASMRAHASQISEEHWFLAMPDEAFAAQFGVEWFRREDAGPGITETDLV
jgi:LmbE family N-acetylglucosaminyl deacetylase